MLGTDINKDPNADTYPNDIGAGIIANTTLGGAPSYNFFLEYGAQNLNLIMMAPYSTPRLSKHQVLWDPPVVSGILILEGLGTKTLSLHPKFLNPTPQNPKPGSQNPSI